MKLFRLILATCLSMALQNADAAPYKLIHAFTGGASDGRTPTFEASLTPSGSVFYGVTQDGGKYNAGVVFQINQNGSGPIDIIHTFDGISPLNSGGSPNDGAYPVGTPVLSGSTLYGMTEYGGSNGPTGIGGGIAYGIGSIYSVNTDHTGFQILHHFNSLNDGWAPHGSLILADSTLYGMTEQGGTAGDSEGVIFSVGTDGSNYQILHSFQLGGQGQGSLLLWGDTLYGMTPTSIFRIGTNGTGFLVFHPFTGTTTDGGNALGSLVRSGPYLYGMTSQGGANSVGTVFQIDLIGSVFQVLHSFALTEANSPHGDLALSGSTLYGMTYGGVTNFHGGFGGSGAVFQINTNGSGYQIMHTFLFPSPASDGSLPFGTPFILGSDLYGMTSLGGSDAPLGKDDGGVIFALTLPANSGASGTAPTITTTSPLPNGKVAVAYKQQLAASGGATPYTWAVGSGHLPTGVTLSAAGLLSGKPTVGEIADFSVKITGHDKLSSSQAFVLTVEAPPTLTIASPKLNQKVTTPTLNISGAVTEKVGPVAAVYFQLNGGAWTPAQIANGTWSYPNLPLPADADVLNAYAVDSFGNFSKTNTVKFEYYVTGLLIVKTNGSGSFTPPDNGKNFQIGSALTITATPARGFVFVNWTNGLGIVLTNKAGLKIVMSSNLTLVAVFAPKLSHEEAPGISLPDNPFQISAGNYSGLFAPSGEIRQLTNSGAIRLTLAASGLFSGKFIIGPDSIPFTGRFDADGSARLIIPSKKSALSATLQLDFAHQSVTGELTDGAFVAQIMSYRGGFIPGTSSQRTYNLVITRADLSSVPPLIATGTLTVDALGNAIFSGKLPDGTRATQTSVVSRERYWPLYLPGQSGSASKNSSLWSWSQITNGTVASLPSISTWLTDTNRTTFQIIGTSNSTPNQN